VRLDGHDARAYVPSALRRAMAWSPQSPDLIYGTIAQNLRLARPDADEAAMRAALAGAHALEAVEAMPRGLDTRVADNAAEALPRSLLVRLTLARALLTDAPFLLLDEAVAGLDDEVADAFAALLQARRGRSTILMVSHRPSHIRLADKVLHLEDGQVTVRAAPPAAPAGLAAPARIGPDRAAVFRPAGAA
jgi:ATP-binding cassette, subfamily C, bacterial LapB